MILCFSMRTGQKVRKLKMMIPSTVMLQLTISLIHCGYKNDFTNFSGIMLDSCWNVSKYHPAWFVYYYDNSLYVITRGSKVSDDYATAAVFTELTSEYGTFHTGYYKAAMYVWSNVKRYVEAFPNRGNVYFIGHSLGAAVSQILHIFAKNELPEKTYYSFNYACPPVMSDGADSKIEKNAYTFVNDDDIVPTLSIPNSLEKFKLIAPVLNLIPTSALISAARDLLKIVNVTSLVDQDLFNMIYEATPTVIEAVKEYEAGEPKLVHYTTGTVFQFRIDDPKKLSQCVIDPKEKLYELSITANCIAHHKHERYQEVIEQVIPENFI